MKTPETPSVAEILSDEKVVRAAAQIVNHKVDVALRTEQLAEAATLRDEGMAQAENAARAEVILAIDAAIEKAIASGRRFSTNDIRDQFPVSSSGLVGARIRSYAGRKDKATGEFLMRRVGYTPSTLPNTHHHPIAVWLGGQAHQTLSRAGRRAS